jgi:hypothetical protein
MFRKRDPYNLKHLICEFCGEKKRCIIFYRPVVTGTTEYDVVMDSVEKQGAVMCKRCFARVGEVGLERREHL